jgi:hypothetical protein
VLHDVPVARPCSGIPRACAQSFASHNYHHPRMKLRGFPLHRLRLQDSTVPRYQAGAGAHGHGQMLGGHFDCQEGEEVACAREV